MVKLIFTIELLEEKPNIEDAEEYQDTFWDIPYNIPFLCLFDLHYLTNWCSFDEFYTLIEKLVGSKQLEDVETVPWALLPFNVRQLLCKRDIAVMAMLENKTPIEAVLSYVKSFNTGVDLGERFSLAADIAQAANNNEF